MTENPQEIEVFFVIDSLRKCGFQAFLFQKEKCLTNQVQASGRITKDTCSLLKDNPNHR